MPLGWEGTAHRDEAGTFVEIAKADGLKFPRFHLSGTDHKNVQGVR